MTDGSSGEGTQVFLVPIDPAPFERTMAEPVDVDSLPESPPALEGIQAARLWGVADGGRTVETFERLAPGDLVLFYDNGTFVGMGRVGRTFEDADGWLSETLWDGEAASYVLTVTDFEAVEIPRAAVNALFDYGPTYAPGGLMRVAPDRVTASVTAIERAILTYDEQRG